MNLSLYTNVTGNWYLVHGRPLAEQPRGVPTNQTRALSSGAPLQPVTQLNALNRQQ